MERKDVFAFRCLMRVRPIREETSQSQNRPGPCTCGLGDGERRRPSGRPLGSGRASAPRTTGGGAHVRRCTGPRWPNLDMWILEARCCPHRQRHASKLEWPRRLLSYRKPCTQLRESAQHPPTYEREVVRKAPEIEVTFLSTTKHLYRT